MNYAEQQRNPLRHALGLTLVVIFHIGLVYGLINGLGHNIIQKLNAPLETKIVQEDKPPPPDTPPPPPPPQMAAPPPPYIPPPDIQLAQPPTTTNAIVAITNKAPPNTNFQRLPPPAPDSGPSSAPSVGGRSFADSYPPDMEEAQRTGRVTVRCDIEVDGRPSNCALVSSVGGSSFGQAAMRVLNSGRVRYRPAIRNGQPVRFPGHTLVITYQLAGE